MNSIVTCGNGEVATINRNKSATFFAVIRAFQRIFATCNIKRAAANLQAVLAVQRVLNRIDRIRAARNDQVVLAAHGMAIIARDIQRARTIQRQIVLAENGRGGLFFLVEHVIRAIGQRVLRSIGQRDERLIGRRNVNAGTVAVADGHAV